MGLCMDVQWLGKSHLSMKHLQYKTFSTEHLSHMFVHIQGSHCLKCIEQSTARPTLQVLLLQVGTSTMHTTIASPWSQRIHNCTIPVCSYTTCASSAMLWELLLDVHTLRVSSSWGGGGGQGEASPLNI